MSVVGERAVAVCPRSVDGRHASEEGLLDCFGSQWAGSDERVGAVLATEGGTAGPLLDCQWEHLGVCDSARLPGSLDYLSLDVVYLVRSDGVRVYLPVWLGIPTAGGVETGGTDGVLLRITSLAALRTLRARIRDLKELFGRAVDARRLSYQEARSCLLATLSVGQHGKPPATCRSTTQQLP